MPSPGSTRPTRTAQVSAYLAAHAFPGVRLHRSARDAYCHFHGGDADYWDETSVMVPRVGDLTLDQWLAEARTCAATARRNPAHRSRVSMPRRHNPDPTAAEIAAYQAFVAQVYGLLKDAGARPLGPLSRWGTITLDGISFQFYPEGGYGINESHPSYARPKLHVSTQGDSDYFPKSGNQIGWSHKVTPEEVAAAIIEYCQSGTVRTNPVGMDAMYHALQQPRIPWASFSVDQIKTVAYGAMKNGDNELYDKAVAALARRSPLRRNGFDHGVLNVPLDKRGGGSIDAQIDRWKKEQAAAQRGAARTAKADKAAAKALFEIVGSALVASTVAKHPTLKSKDVLHTLDQMVKWEPTKALKVLTDWATANGY